MNPGMDVRRGGYNSVEMILALGTTHPTPSLLELSVASI